MPTTGYTIIPEVRSVPDTNVAPDKLETTTLQNENNKTYVYGLKDYGDLEFEAIMTNHLYSLYFDETSGIMATYEKNKSSGLRMWICIDPDGLDKSEFIPVIPQGLSTPSGNANEVFIPKLRFTPVGDLVIAADPTYDTGA
jgi:hypothetical protein